MKEEKKKKSVRCFLMREYGWIPLKNEAGVTATGASLFLRLLGRLLQIPNAHLSSPYPLVSLSFFLLLFKRSHSIRPGSLSAPDLTKNVPARKQIIPTHHQLS